MNSRVILTLAALMLLAGCGNNPADRVLSGAGVGAGSGLVGAAIVGGSLVTGAAVGAAAGAIIGGVTSANDIDLGKPIWK